MLDYRGIEALHAVQELQSFEIAAKQLHITQSAISQRIKSLERHYGEPLLIRTLPYRPTKLGEYLIGHFKRVCLLENSLNKQIGSSESQLRLSIALNRDSLETWFLDLLQETALFNNVALEIIADDQELTIDYLKKGIVSACLSTSSKPIQDAKATFVGNMEYFLVASPSFIKRYFSKKDPKKCLLEAPAIKFDANDKLHERYLEKFFGLNGEEMHFHIVPSVQGFKKFALWGYGYALIPKIDILKELENKELIQLYEDKTWQIPLYWHYWEIDSKFYKQFNLNIIHHVKKMLSM